MKIESSPFEFHGSANGGAGLPHRGSGFLL
jgi:hypothetical protein